MLNEVVENPDHFALRNGRTVADGIDAIYFHLDRKSTRLNSSHRCISYAVFCLKKKNRIVVEASGLMPLSSAGGAGYRRCSGGPGVELRALHCGLRVFNRLI